MSELVIIIPTRGRSHTVVPIAQAFRSTCTADTELVFAADDDDPELPLYEQEVTRAQEEYPATRLVVHPAPGNMVASLNLTASQVFGEAGVAAVGFQGDDHRPRTLGWDRHHLDALERRPGIAYGNDLLRGEDLPTQFAVSSHVARALGFLAPPFLKHMYVDNYWRDVGRAAGALTYLPGTIVEHLHPAAGKSEVDASYQRTYEFFHPDAQAYEKTMTAAELRRHAQIILDSVEY